MAYSDFTSLQKLQHELDISHQRNDLFSQIKSVTPSAKLQDDLEESRQYSLLTEKAKSEFLITPVLKEVHRTHPDKVGIFSGVSLDLPEAGLGGFL
ncbi:Uncharacterised protein [Candidatus Venteria ishoeyi]|uniref:Uncharacterized protein n=2 Tax=Candidatus Venteria ishoeyi TaxID=1899563 RepID=A0A1H6F6N0_9GAMM|nr:Uncharacterised protein [Candidatus Venteria ishoeyi]